MTSHSKLLKFYGISDVDDQLSLYLIKDMAAHFPAHLVCDATSMTCLPPPKKLDDHDGLGSRVS